MIVSDLRTERRINPLGLDCARPRFSWRILSDDCGALQSAYEIQVAIGGYALEAGELLWSSGKVVSDQSQLIGYAGPPLASRERRVWRARVWDRCGEAGQWSAPASFEMGLLSSDAWQAKWISPVGQKVPEQPEPPALLRRDVVVREGIASARLYVTAQGAYDAEINGVRVGDLVLAPGWTSYRNQIQYQVHDVTSLLANGANAIGVTLGDGWFRGPIFCPPRRAVFGERSALLLQLELEYADGSRDMVVSDSSWKCATGPILLSELCAGETYDARLERPGWSSAGYDDADWNAVEELPAGEAALIAQNGSPLRRMGEVAPKSVGRAPSGKIIVDFGQNMVGWVRVRAGGEAGHKIVLRHAEVLDKEGELYTANLRTAAQTCTWTLKGEGPEQYEPHFTLQGFRFVEVEGLNEQQAFEGLTGIVVHSDMAMSGSFETSDPLLNQLQSNILWGQRSNFIDVPLDCPQRDERLGWTGDAQVFAPTAMFNMDAYDFFKRWLSDMALEQGDDGSIPWVVPTIFSNHSAAGWGDAATIIPMALYRQYGDRELLETHYPMMRKWVAYQAGRAGEEHIWKGDFQFGDWLDFFSATRGVDGGMTSEDLIATAFHARSTALTGEAATILGRDEDAADFALKFAAIREAFCNRFVSSEGVIGEDTQTAYALSLSFDLVTGELAQKAAARLAADVRFRGHLTTGFLGTPLLLDTLMRFGFVDEARLLLFRKEYPSWLYPPSMGATTIWERWGGIKPDGNFYHPFMNSFNHYAYGAVGDWMYRNLGGLSPDPASPGFKRFNAAPLIVPELDYVRLRYESDYGEILLGWERHRGRMRIDLTIPPNSEAVLTLPGAARAEVTESGGPLATTDLVVANGDRGDLALNLRAGRYRYEYPVG